MVWFIDRENKDMRLEPCDMDPHHSRLAIAKLAEYEDLEEQGLLIRLPCHCKDCKYVDYEGTDSYCLRNSAFMQEDDFCKYAEKDEYKAEEKLRELEG